MVTRLEPLLGIAGHDRQSRGHLVLIYRPDLGAALLLLRRVDVANVEHSARVVDNMKRLVR